MRRQPEIEYIRSTVVEISMYTWWHAESCYSRTESRFAHFYMYISLACVVVICQVGILATLCLYSSIFFLTNTLARTHQLANIQEHHIARTNIKIILIRLENSSVNIVLNIFSLRENGSSQVEKRKSEKKTGMG